MLILEAHFNLSPHRFLMFAGVLIFLTSAQYFSKLRNDMRTSVIKQS